ncbi:UNVERIFIED_CONTAM: hypothetical protein GTU68_057445 [Idotea baltica]|nr:hypothetical protein [Idotea baltica]
MTRPDMDEQEYQAVASKFEKMIKDSGANLINVEHWGQQKLAYEISKFNSAYYTYIEFEGNPQANADTEREFGYDERILRYLTVKVGKHHAAFNIKRREVGFGKKKKEEAK